MFTGTRWKRIGKTKEAAEFLRARELRCVGAGSRFLHMDRSRDHIWVWLGADREIGALILHSRRTLFPVSDRGIIPPPRFIKSFLRKNHLHAIQGLRKDVEQLELAVTELGYYPSERLDYDLMTLDRAPAPETRAGPPGLILRKPGPGDEEELFVLQAAYEQEEVLPRGVVFNPASCRLSLEHILKREQILVAELGSRVVGKINTSAASFSRCQIGGVYVLPDYRGRGIAHRMGTAFARELVSTGLGLNLFVKKRNAAARAVYRRIGFDLIGDYRISYYPE